MSKESTVNNRSISNYFGGVNHQCNNGEQRENSGSPINQKPIIFEWFQGIVQRIKVCLLVAIFGSVNIAFCCFATFQKRGRNSARIVNHKSVSRRVELRKFFIVKKKFA